MDEKTEGQRGEGTCLRSHCYEVAKLGMKERESLI